MRMLPEVEDEGRNIVEEETEEKRVATINH